MCSGWEQWTKDPCLSHQARYLKSRSARLEKPWQWRGHFEGFQKGLPGSPGREGHPDRKKQRHKVQEAKHIHCGKARSLVQQLESKEVRGEETGAVWTVRKNCSWRVVKVWP